MLPILFSLDPITFKTLKLFQTLGFLIAVFVFWRKGREEHYSQTSLLDAFMLSSIVGLLAARVGFIVVHFQKFGWNPFTWLDPFAHPGSVSIVGVVVATLYLAKFARKQKWDVFEVLDFWSLSLSIGLFMTAVGRFFDGTGFGVATNLPWGFVFPGVFEPHHPTQLYSGLFFILLFIFLTKVEYRYRTFKWYRSSKKSAQTGFLLSVFVILSAVFSLALLIVKPAEFMIGGLELDAFVYGFILIYGLGLLYIRSGRSFLFWRGK